jgi:hypothetical protein
LVEVDFFRVYIVVPSLVEAPPLKISYGFWQCSLIFCVETMPGLILDGTGNMFFGWLEVLLLLKVQLPSPLGQHIILTLISVTWASELISSYLR